MYTVAEEKERVNRNSQVYSSHSAPVIQRECKVEGALYFEHNPKFALR